MTSDTPRTDAVEPQLHSNVGGWVRADFARQLERELNESKEETEDLIFDLNASKAEVERLRSELKSSVNLLAKFNTLRLCKSASLTQEQWDKYCRLYRDYN